MNNEKPLIIREIFDESSLEFTDHLLIPGNHRVIFTGAFGTGKTTFLKDFFSEENQEKLAKRNGVKYKCIHLFPVNYQVSENADVFEYIKYDIFTRLLQEPGLEVDSERIKFAIALPFLLSNNLSDILSPIARLASALSIGGFSLKGLGAAYDKINDLRVNITQQFEELKKSELDEVKEFIDEFRSNKGTIYEQDIYTLLISDLVGRLTNNEQKSEVKEESVLIIDDLDRIDPHHTFRLFNVFSAHFDQYLSGVEEDIKVDQINKFGFDKIVFVCDIDNVRSLFFHFYGASASFSGYIDKFYSKIPFTFNPTPVIIKYFNSFYVFDVNGDYSSLGVEKGSDDAKSLSEYLLSTLIQAEFFKVLEEMIKISIEANGTTLRTLTKLRHSEFKIDSEQHIEASNGTPIKQGTAFIVILCKFLYNFAGGVDELIYFLRRCDNYVQARPNSLSYKRYIFKHCIAYLGYEDKLQSTYQLDNQGLMFVHYSVYQKTFGSSKHAFVFIEDDFYISSSSDTIKPSTGVKLSFNKVNVFPLLIRVVERLKSTGYFN